MFNQPVVIGPRALILIAMLLAGHSVFAQQVATDPSQYPDTIAELQNRYSDEVIAHQKYNAYAQQALEEGYPNIAHLFRALASSEAVHARNFRTLLNDLGVAVEFPDIPEYRVKTTKKNIQHATSVEANEIDNKYPEILKAIESENHADAIRNITYAWEAEKQHRELIVKIEKASSRFFGLIVKRIEGKPSHYHVCQICGSTLTKLPAEMCPICDHPVSEYREVPGFPGFIEPEKPKKYGFEYD